MNGLIVGYGTAVPIKEREMISQVNTDIKTYTLPPEELAKYQALPVNKPRFPFKPFSVELRDYYAKKKGD